MKSYGINYSKSRIFKLVSAKTKKIFIGGCTQTLTKKIYTMKLHYKEYVDGKRDFQPEFDILKHPDCQIILIENYPCESLEILQARVEKVKEKPKKVKTPPQPSPPLLENVNSDVPLLEYARCYDPELYKAICRHQIISKIFA
ncbi:MAG: hypothetical protein EBQ92_00765 [Proteobacteria bacterium]|nr:hypothetical protein [Pseudomonadota bacterium]